MRFRVLSFLLGVGAAVLAPWVIIFAVVHWAL
jgi:hypothetical protein